MSRKISLDDLRKCLKIEVQEGGFTDPNARTIAIKWVEPGDDEGEILTEATIDIKNRREYEG